MAYFKNPLRTTQYSLIKKGSLAVSELDFTIWQLCDFRQVIQLLWALFPIYKKGETTATLILIKELWHILNVF